MARTSNATLYLLAWGRRIGLQQIEKISTVANEGIGTDVTETLDGGAYQAGLGKESDWTGKNADILPAPN